MLDPKKPFDLFDHEPPLQGDKDEPDEFDFDDGEEEEEEEEEE